MARSVCLLALALFAFAAVVSAQDIQDVDTDVVTQTSNGACGANTVSGGIALALQNSPTLSNFRSLVAAAGAQLGAQRPKEVRWTVFAPTNDVLTAAITATLLTPANNAQLLQVLRTHITTSGAFPSKALATRNNQVLVTAQPGTSHRVQVGARTAGVPPTITIAGPTTSATVVAPINIKACKSFIHGINAILS